MEIAGYLHYENACSNILAFFMDQEEPHGLGTLVLDALASAGNIAAVDEEVGGNVSVEREDITHAGNRIDILIESDDRTVLIENKIYAAASNLFEDYAAYLGRRTPEGRTKHKLLLTLYPTNEGSKWGFRNLTYTEFVGEIRSLLGSYVSNADTRHLTILLDFLNTLENLQRGTRMDREFVKFLAERSDDIRDLFANLKRLRAEMREKVQELGTLIDVSRYPSVETKDHWRADTVAMFDNLYFRIRVAEDFLVGIDVHLTPQGWEIRIFPRPEREPYYSKLRSVLQSLKIEFEQRQGWRRLICYPKHLAYDENLDRIRPVLQDLVDKLATSQERKE